MNRNYIFYLFFALISLNWTACQTNNKNTENPDPIPEKNTEKDSINTSNNTPKKITPTDFSTITIAFYNVENLFDTKDNPAINDEDFLPDGRNKWTDERYQLKLQKLAQAIDSLGDTDGAEILGLAEVENQAVLEDLLKTERLKSKNYGIIHFDSPDKRGIDVAMLYKRDVFKPILEKNIPISFANEPDFKTRDILLVSGQLRGEPVHFIWSHFPSRRGGQQESEPYRKAVGRQIRVVIDEIFREQPQAKILVGGDFNDLPENASVKTELNAKPNPDYSKKELFNPTYELMTHGKGTYNYRGKWQMLDQVLLSEGWINTRTGFQYIQRSTKVYAPEFLKQQTDNQYKGNPDRTFAGAKYLKGYSDHFPIYAQFGFLNKGE